MTDLTSIDTTPSARSSLRNYFIASSLVGASWLASQVVDVDPSAALPSDTLGTTAYAGSPIRQFVIADAFESGTGTLTSGTGAFSENHDLGAERIATIVLKTDDIPTDPEEQVDMVKSLINQSGEIGIRPLYEAIVLLYRDDILWNFLRTLGEEEYRPRIAEIVPLLRAVLSGPDAGARAAASSSLAALGTPDALAALRAQLDRENNRFVRGLIEAYVT
jgi:HEAT repeats